MKNKMKRKISESLDLPKEVIMNVPYIRILGNDELQIENHKGIVEYSSDIVRLKSSIGIIKIEGKDFLIKEINPEIVVFTGKIKNLEFIKI
ncbi:MAG: yqfC [Caloramator sp.]|jgi:sporulation protein YqfC|uniref:sporulation protein YqfC n=1 Tax=Caloramator sp. TaxID=1871330 RepID=UPI001DF24B9A|nr:sporulation protein YqfC [Caloramator sp.]MBZ4663136.1 yqfC [Caloramator sp.]